jgi:hypothetical protein
MRNMIASFVAGVLAAALFVSTAGADAETLHEQKVLRALERIAAALEKDEATHRDEVQAERDLVRSVRDVAGRCR